MRALLTPSPPMWTGSNACFNCVSESATLELSQVSSSAPCRTAAEDDCWRMERSARYIAASVSLFSSLKCRERHETEELKSVNWSFKSEVAILSFTAASSIGAPSKVSANLSACVRCARKLSRVFHALSLLNVKTPIYTLDPLASIATGLCFLTLCLFPFVCLTLSLSFCLYVFFSVSLCLCIWLSLVARGLTRWLSYIKSYQTKCIYIYIYIYMQRTFMR